MANPELDRRLDAFCAWLGRHGVPGAEEYRSLARGLYLLRAEGEAVAATHVARSVELARDAGADGRTLGTLEWLGEQLLVFEDEMKTLRRHTDGMAAMSERDAADEADAPAATTGLEGRAGLASASAETAAGDESDLETPPGGATPQPAARAGRRGLPAAVIAVALVAVALVAGGAAVALRGPGEDAVARKARAAAAPPPAPEASPAPGPAAPVTGTALDGLALALELPDGWHAAPPPAGANPIAAGAQLYRGDSPSRPERSAWLSVLPLPASLTGAQISPETLAIIGDFIDEGLAGAVGDTYRREGCAPAAGDQATIVCRAVAGSGDEAAHVFAYVRFHDFRALVAVFVAAAANEAAAVRAEADAVMAAVRDTVPGIERRRE